MVETFLNPLNPPLDKAPQHWRGLHGCALAIALAHTALENAHPTVVVVADEQRAFRLHEELRFFLDQKIPLYHFPDWETLPYDVFSPHSEIISQRLSMLHALPSMGQSLVIIAADSLLQPLPPRHYIDGRALIVKVGQTLDPIDFRNRLETAGYVAVTEVHAHGEFALRGSVLDLFPMGANQPYRLDLFDDEIDTIRSFDPESQRSVDKIDAINLLPAHEFPFDAQAIKDFRQRYRQYFSGDPAISIIYRDISRGIIPGGIESYLSLFFEHTANLFDYLPNAATLIALGDVKKALHNARLEIDYRYEQRHVNPERPLMAPDDIFVSPEFLSEHIEQNADITYHPKGSQRDQNFASQAVPELIGQSNKATGKNFQRFFNDFDGRILITGASAGRREAMRDWLTSLGMQPARVEGWHAFLQTNKAIAVADAALEAGTVLVDESLAIVSESQLTGSKPPTRKKRRRVRDPETTLRELTDLSLGAPVVHQDHGVGRYKGLQTLTAGGVENEFVTLEYAGSDKLYVPVTSLHLVHRFTGADADSAPLHKLGNDRWSKARKKAAKRAHDVAAELLEIQAKRHAKKGLAIRVDDQEYHRFADSFPFTETPDQARAINEVLSDLAKDTPMDRVVCGDVGFGKTEVALRAAFVSVMAGYQVALLVPTTLLAQQHYQNFADRFADWPVRVGVLSRMGTAKQRSQTLAQMQDGSLDIVVGTHRLLQKDIRFKKLGLLIVDEEHRFGVRHKERIKNLRAQVDLLTLTATPIPRTLNMSLSGLRDLSIIATPPESRVPIQTFVEPSNNTLIQDACQREIRRGGQVYYVHNKVKDIEKRARDLAELLPNAHIRIAHGQMHERELEAAMLDFYHRRFDILLCTTIVESGIDVPSANTIIIDRADTFGLSQLHQLRGRVGRSHHRAFAYMLTPPKSLMTADAKKRIDALSSLTDLGAGFTLATHDLEIRGAGELLGEGQSGQIQEIGFDLYRQMLDRAVGTYKSGKVPEADSDLAEPTEIELGTSALLPDDYIPDVHARLVLYKRISAAKDNNQLRELKVELIDRFGLLPEPTETLFSVTELKLLAQPLGLKKIEAGPDVGRLHFGRDNKIDPAQLIALIQSDSQAYKLQGDSRLLFYKNMDSTEEKIITIKELLAKLNPK